MTESNEVKEVRLHVGGLPGKISEKDIEDRFRSFGTVQKVDLIPHPFEEGACRGFAYVNLETTDAQLSKCMNVLNGCSWKGGKLFISLAKPNKFRTLEDGRIVVIKSEEEDKKKKKIPKKKRKLVRHAGDFTLVNDKNVDKRKGWRRGRYGRAIACLRIRRPNRQMLIIDPSHYKNNLEKLFGSVRPKPLSQLCWTITDIVEPTELVENENMNDYSENSENSEYFDAIEIDNTEITEDKLENIQEDSAIMEPVESLVEATLDSVESAVEPVVEPVNVSELEQSNTVKMDTEQIDETIENTTVDSQELEESVLKQEPAKPEPKFEVNVNWSSLFAPKTENDTSSGLFGSITSNEASGFSLTSLIEKSAKIKNVSVDDLFKKQPESQALAVPEVSKAEESVQAAPVKKVHNYAHLFGDLNRITPTTATRFGMHLTRKEDMLQEWRIERVELKEDFKKRLAEGKRRNRRGNRVNN